MRVRETDLVEEKLRAHHRRGVIAMHVGVVLGVVALFVLVVLGTLREIAIWRLIFG